VLKCQDCKLWERHEAPGVPRQVIGHCRGPATIKFSKHAPIGVTYSWPNTFENDYCELHPEFDKTDYPIHDEPFWTCPPDDPGPPIKHRVSERKKKLSQASLFD
jgi:hypothetical protein